MTHLSSYLKVPATVNDVADFPEDGEVVDLQHRLERLEGEIHELDAFQATLEELRSIASDMDHPTQTEIDLLRLNVRTVLADSRISTEALIPGLESASAGDYTTVSLEDVDKTLDRIYKTVVKWMRTIWEYIVAFYRKVTDNTERLKRQNDNMRDRMQVASKGQLQQKRLELDSEIAHLTMDGKVPTGGKEIIEGLQRLRVQGDVIYRDYTDSLAKAGNSLADAISAFDPDKPHESLERVYEAAKEVDFRRMIQLSKGKTVQDKRWKDGAVSALDPLPGNKSIFFYYPAVTDEQELLAKAELRRRKSVLFEDTSEKGNKGAKGGVINTIEPSDGYEIHRLNGEILGMLSDYGKQRSTIDKAHRRVQGAVDKLNSMQKKASATAAGKIYFEQVIKFAQAYSFWVKNPQVGLTAQIQKTIRASILACNKSATNYRTM